MRQTMRSTTICLVNATLPQVMQSEAEAQEQWTDVPAASEDYAAASAALKRHIEELIDDLSHSDAH